MIVDSQEFYRWHTTRMISISFAELVPITDETSIKQTPNWADTLY